MNLDTSGLQIFNFDYSFAADNFLLPKNNTKMEKRLLSAIAVGVLGASSLNAQLYVTPKQATFTGVSNEGIAIGSADQNEPFILWNPVTGETTGVGGISSGNGIGGVGRITADGRTVFATNNFEEISLGGVWNVNKYKEFSDYQITGFMKVSQLILLATGVKSDGSGSMVFESSAGDGRAWHGNVTGDTFENETITCISYAGPYTMFVGCESGKVFQSKGNSVWTETSVLPAGFDSEVKRITAIDFTKMGPSDMYFSGGIGYEAADGGYGVWYTHDASTRYADYYEAEGVSGLPTCISVAGDKFFMTTANGRIQKSTDECKTWEDVMSVDVPLHKLAFDGSQNGVAISDNLVFITHDGGETWGNISVQDEVNSCAQGEDFRWNDVAFSEGCILLAGNEGSLYISSDNGSTFVQEKLPDEVASSPLLAVESHDDVINIGTTDGRFLHTVEGGVVDAVSAGRYDRDVKDWFELGNLGAYTMTVYNTLSGVDAITEDGTYCVGLAYKEDSENHFTVGCPVIWYEDEVYELGNMFIADGRAARATGVSSDGSVVVGWQDKKGPWMASVWRRQADGNYVQQLMLKDENMSIEDIDFDDFDQITENCVGAANAVSPNGKWIGGLGGGLNALPEAWIWSEETGYRLLGMEGTTMEVSDDGKMAIGYGASGFGGWLWTEEEGIRDLNSIAAELGAEFDGFGIASVYGMSANGRYLCGWGMKGDSKRGYVLDLKYNTTDVEKISDEQIKATVYPNPVAEELHIDLPYDASTIRTTATLYSTQGNVCRVLNDCGQSNIMDVSSLSSGIYILRVAAGNADRTFKVVVK